MNCSSTEKDIAAQKLDSLSVSLDWCKSTFLLLHHPSCNLCNLSVWCGVALITSRVKRYSISALEEDVKVANGCGLGTGL